ncbi:C39 family peptidase [Mediterraneibacter massiliensis]|jgi:uncharacterized protein YvpB|uniref:C39 family peptidase n=1 Tax=Mediterraneibacter massiliensis TaxID=1720300 RepID=UPI0022E69E1C|nr:C39 family peptidase [Mediterraneibacter massiliensis]
MLRIDVPYIDQSKRYPTGCESVSATMLLQFLGIEITVDEFIQKYLACREFQSVDGELYGPDPYKYFCGSPYDEDSFGCYAPVICQALKKALQDAHERKMCGERKWIVLDETGQSMEYLTDTYLDKGIPVILWACINMREPIVGPQWKLLDSKERFTWVSNEHCMLLTGYDEKGYYFNDPYENNGVVYYEKELTNNRYIAQKMQAIGIREI